MQSIMPADEYLPALQFISPLLPEMTHLPGAALVQSPDIPLLQSRFPGDHFPVLQGTWFVLPGFRAQLPTATTTQTPGVPLAQSRSPVEYLPELQTT